MEVQGKVKSRINKLWYHGNDSLISRKHPFHSQSVYIVYVIGSKVFFRFQFINYETKLKEILDRDHYTDHATSIFIIPDSTGYF